MSAQLNVGSSKGRSSPSFYPSVVQKGRFMFRLEKLETRISATALASRVQGHYENFCLVGKVFVASVPGRIIHNKFRND